MLQNSLVIKSDYTQPNRAFMNEMRLFVKSIDGEIFSFSMKNHDLIKDIKLKIYDKIGLNVEQQILCYQGAILEDMRELNDYEIINYSIIDVVGRLRGGMHIFIKLIDGRRIELEINENDNVKDLKLKVQEKIRMFPEEQILVYRGMVLDDDEKMLSECEIRTTSIINIVANLRIRISVKMDNNTVEEIDVQKFDEIIDLKKKIQRKTGLHPDEQKLIYQGGILEDDKTIDEYQICGRSDITVVATLRIKISFKTTDGKRVEMKVQRSLNIIDLKIKIEERTGLSVNKQKLIYQGEILDDDYKSIDEYQICDQSVIDIVAKITILITRCKKTMITIEVYETDRIMDLKKEIRDKLQLYLNNHTLVYQGVILDDDKTINEYQICDQSVICLRHNELDISVKLQNDKTFITKALFSYKIIDLKRIIQDQSKIEPDDQILIFKNEILEDDNKTIDEYQIYDQSLIHLEAKLKIFEKQIFVKTNDGKTIEIKMNQFNKIIDLKHNIEKQTRLQPNEQILIYQGRILSDDDKTIDEYQIGDQSVINVVVRISIFVSIGEKIAIVEIYKTDKIKDLKHKIQDKLGFNTDKHELFFNDKMLDDDDKIIEEYQICDQSRIYLRSNKIEISITMINNENIAIQAQVSDKITDIKKKVECQTLLQSNDQILFYRGEQLDDNQTIDDYQICDQSVLHLKYEIGLFIKTIDGKTVTCQVKKSDKIIDVKRKIQEKIGLHWYEQILVYKGAMLKNSERIDHYEICDNSVITIVARLRYDKLQINVKKVDVYSVLIEVKKSLKVIDLKEKIQQRTNLQRAQQVLVYDEKILNDDEKIIDECQICDLAVIYVSCRNEWS